MAAPIDYAMMVLKQWDDVNWEQAVPPEAVGQESQSGLINSDDPRVRQMLQPWPEGTNTDWQYGPPESWEKRGPVLSAEEAMQRDKQRQQMAQHKLRYQQSMYRPFMPSHEPQYYPAGKQSSNVASADLAPI